MDRGIRVAFFACFLVFITACGSSKKDETTDLATGEELSSSELPEAGTDPVPEASIESPPQALSEPSTTEALAEAPPIPESLPTQEEPLAGDALTEVETPIPDPVPSGSAVMSGESSDYSVQSGDTLMKIAFEVYGDLYAWKRIYELNKDVVRDPNRIPRGTKLKLEAPQSPVSVQRSGDRYVIKKGDTLGKISNQVYGTPEKWRKIWDNNRQLIKDPNRIYAGFTLYYENDAGSGSTPGQPLGEAPGSSDPSRVPSSGTSGDTL